MFNENVFLSNLRGNNRSLSVIQACQLQRGISLFQAVLSIYLSSFKLSSLKFLETVGFKPETAGWAASVLSTVLCSPPQNVSLSLQDLEAAKAAFEEAAAGGHPEAQMGLGFLFATGSCSLVLVSYSLLKQRLGLFKHRWNYFTMGL